jgi:hypothetical protein
MFYAPLVPFFLYKIIRAGNPVYFLVTNPGILYSGCGSESKFKTLLLIPEEFRPKSILMETGISFATILERMKIQGISYPLIVKPDIGFRGYLVKKIDNEQELQDYFIKVKTAVILQEFINFDHEIGVFYHRIPGEQKGEITSITIKKYLTLIGDGKMTLSELIQSDKRAFLYFDLLKNIHKENMEIIIPKGEKKTLSFIGNHSKGTQFLDGKELINKKLNDVIDKLNHEIKGWFYGRIDLKYNTKEDLYIGENFKIIEINGIISEPTHIYDATGDATYFDAINEIKNHWKIIDKIALKNHKEYGIAYPALKPYIQNMLALKTHANMLKKMNKS